MKRVIITILLALGLYGSSLAHNRAGAVTWNREVSRVFFARCASCHRKGGTSFSLMTYAEVQPRLVAIKHQVLDRKMPPWGAVKGFGNFRNDQALTQEEIELIADWIEGDAPRGNNPNVLPPIPKFTKPVQLKKPKDSLEISGDLKLIRPFILDGLLPEVIREDSTARITAAFPDGHTEPLLWLYQYDDKLSHPFLFRNPISLPVGTFIQGVPQGARITLLPGKKSAVKGN